eukprot:TRINITY_DN5355_c0_g1_i2.p2 TRINITY_DN5355_c0_g1~~TRINITY_DN5355_c0_g1_i2.p2  ORF type:complete len:327 (+),score=94.31 TRINITY_DN5355_c0_g1_i2:73-1053(+)
MSSLFSSSTVIDSILFRDAFGTQAMRDVFSDRTLIARYIEVEVALAKAEARCGVIPAEAAQTIERESRLDRIDFDHMRHETDIVGYPILPLVHQLVAMCGDAGRYVHWGATTQDIMDTANVLQVRDALDIMIMASTEFAEVYEPFVKGRGASSTMPQKRNPISSELMLAASKAVRQHAGLMVDAMVQDFERATGPWHAEWIAIPESFILTAGALHQAKFALGGLIVDTDQMRRNLGISRGLIVAEAVMMGLAPAIGRQQAHDVVYDACRVVNEQGGSLADALAALPAVTAHFDRAAIDRLTDPSNYLGLAPVMVDRALASSAAVKA